MKRKIRPDRDVTMAMLDSLTEKELSECVSAAIAMVGADAYVPDQLHSCNACGTTEAMLGDYQRCGGCKDIFYCSPECQKTDWSKHKKSCKRKNKK